MSALLKLLDLDQGADADTWIGPASGPAGKRSYGGQFVAQSLAAACHTVDADRPPTNMHLQFLRGGEAGDPVEYTVARVFDGRTAAARRVDSHQAGRLRRGHGFVRRRVAGPEHGHRPDMPGDPDAAPHRTCRARTVDATGRARHQDRRRHLVRRIRTAIVVAGDGSATR
jgi:acyl-CoA thioesterase II